MEKYQALNFSPPVYTNQSPALSDFGLNYSPPSFPNPMPPGLMGGGYSLNMYSL